MGTEVDDVVRGADDGLFVLHDHNGVAEVAKTVEDADEPVGVVGMEADAGLVEDIGAAHQAAAKARAELDALALAPTQGGASPVEGQVAQSDVEQELETVPHFEQEAAPDFLLGERVLESIEDGQDLLDGQAEQIGQGVTVDAHISCFGAEAAAPQWSQAVRPRYRLSITRF